MQQSASSWQLAALRASLEGEAIEAAVDVANPCRGLAALRINGHATDGWLLGVDVAAPAPPSDAYVRGSDLVLTYQEADARPFSVQIYWSIGRSTPLAGTVILDSAISIQTRQWEAHPSVTVRSFLAESESIALDASALVVRPAGVEWSYVEVVPAEDFVRAATGNDGASSGWIYGGHFLERGVIRRLRVRGAIVPRSSDLDAAVRLRTQLLAEQPPLTA